MLSTVWRSIYTTQRIPHIILHITIGHIWPSGWQITGTFNAVSLTSSVQYTVDFTLIKKLRVLCLHAFKLDSNLLSSSHVCSQVDISERSAPDLAPEAVLLSHTELHCCFVYEFWRWRRFEKVCNWCSGKSMCHRTAVGRLRKWVDLQEMTAPPPLLPTEERRQLSDVRAVGGSEKNNKRKIAKYGGKSSLARFALQFQIERKNVYTALITSKM